MTPVLDIKQLKSLCYKKQIILFGAGEYGKRFIDLSSELDVTIKCIFDNYKSDGYIRGIPVYNFKDMKKIISSKDIIIITSYFYCFEIEEQLKREGYKPNDDYVIWGDKNLSSLSRFIEHNYSVWRKKEKHCTKNKIFVTYEYLRQVHNIMLSYLTNYLLDKYDATVYGIPFTAVKESSTLQAVSDPWLKELYRSFNVFDLISDLDLNCYQLEKARKICEDIWPTLNDENEWMNIEIFGENFGRRILRNYYKFYQYPPFLSNADWQLKNYLLCMLKKIIFWHDYFSSNSCIKAIIVHNGIYSDSFMVGEAVKYGIPVYHIGVDQEYRLTSGEYHVGSRYTALYKNVFSCLPKEEQEKALIWGKERLHKRMTGDVADIPYMAGKSPYASVQEQDWIQYNNKTKVVICPHSFDDDIFPFSWQIFTSVWAWLCYLGELSNKTPYDWYIKEHPAADERDRKVIDELLQQYPNIIRIPSSTSAITLKRAGIRFALTCWGTIGHEYPAIGIQVINAGDNPHIQYDFDWNPKSIGEYVDIMWNLDNLNKEVNLRDIYEFYFMHYHYFKAQGKVRNGLFQNIRLKSDDVIYDDNFDWYKLYLEQEWSKEQHEKTKQCIEQYFVNLDQEYEMIIQNG